MMNANIRTTITLQPSLLARIRIVSQRKKQPLSAFVQKALRSALEKEDALRLDQMYRHLGTMVGTIKEPIPHASEQIDEMLYGQEGLWKGDSE